MKSIFKKFILSITLTLLFTNHVFSEIVKKIEINGNDRIPKETIKIFSNIDIDDDVNDDEINKILKNLYETDYFSSIDVIIQNNILKINVVENPIIYNLKFETIKSKSLVEEIKSVIDLKERSAYNISKITNAKNILKTFLRKKGYFFANVEIFKEEIENNRINIIIDIDLGEKSKIKKISL